MEDINTIGWIACVGCAMAFWALIIACYNSKRIDKLERKEK